METGERREPEGDKPSTNFLPCLKSVAWPVSGAFPMATLLSAAIPKEPSSGPRSTGWTG
jgi:hypothetical protein